jgi:hypothetical protein
MRLKLFLILLYIVLGSYANAALDGGIERDLIMLSLERSDGKFDIVDPITIYYPPAQRKDWNLDWIRVAFKKQGFDVGNLAGKLHDINHEETKLTIESSINKGFVIDYDLKLKEYLKFNFESFPKLYKDHPNAGCFVSISLPVYDKQSNIVLIEKNYRCPPGGGAFIQAYRFENGKLTRIGIVRTLID